MLHLFKSIFLAEVVFMPPLLVAITYTSEDIAIVMGSVGILIGVLTTSIVSIINLIKTSKVEAHVNSQATKYVEQISSRDKEIEILKSVIMDKDRDKALLAQAAVSHPVVSNPLPVAGKAEKSLEAIDDNTEKIEVNTKKTEDVVKKLRAKEK